MYLPNINLEDIIKITLIIFLSGIIGYNREKSGMLVGVRTHILVGLSAVLLQIVALKISITPSFSGDPARLGGQMLTGIGFLGAGSILKENRSIRGLTTAASIFFVACVGLTVGFGYYIIAILTTIIAYLFLTDALKLKKYIKEKRTNKLMFSLTYNSSSNVDIKDILDTIATLDIEVESIDIEKLNEITLLKVIVNSTDEVGATDIITELSQLKFLTGIKQI